MKKVFLLPLLLLFIMGLFPVKVNLTCRSFRSLIQVSLLSAKLPMSRFLPSGTASINLKLLLSEMNPLYM